MERGDTEQRRHGTTKQWVGKVRQANASRCSRLYLLPLLYRYAAMVGIVGIAMVWVPFAVLNDQCSSTRVVVVVVM